MKKMLLYIFLMFSNQLDAHMECEYNLSTSDYEKFLENSDYLNWKLEHKFEFTDDHIIIKSLFNNKHDETFIFEKWNNYGLPLIKIFQINGKNLKFIPGKREVQITKVKGIIGSKGFECKPLVIFKKSLIKHQYLQFNLNENYSFNKQHTYCLETKPLFLNDIGNSIVARLYSSVHILWFDEEWKQKELNQISTCEDEQIDTKIIGDRH